MKTTTHLLLPLFLVLPVACSGVSEVGGIPVRNGPEFAQAFPEPSLLVTTLDPEEVSGLLATVQLPETDEHHQQLKQILQETDELATEHLLLLTEAVAMPGISGVDGATTTRIYTENSRTVVWSRGGGGYAPVVDELLLAGVSKLTDPSPANLGQLLEKTQEKETVVALVEQLASAPGADDWDDGSTTHGWEHGTGQSVTSGKSAHTG